MGLDMLELMLDVEETFSIQISDEQVSRVGTLGELHTLIVGMVKDRPLERKCFSSAHFCRLREGFVVGGWRREAIVPSTPLEELLPAHNRWTTWRELERRTNLRLPSLTRPGWLQFVIVMTCFAEMIWVNRDGAGTFASLAAGATTGLVLWVVTVPFKLSFPPQCHTVEDLAKRVAMINEGARSAVPRPGDEEAWEILREIVGSQLQMPVEHLGRETRLGEDLGLR